MAEEAKQTPETRASQSITRPEATSETQPALDAAGQSLARALRMSFFVLTVVILFLVVVFLSQGVFTVKAGQKKIVLRFGRADESMVMDEGLNYAFPFPIDEVVAIDTKPKKLEVNTFWPRVTEQAKQNVAEGREEQLPESVAGAKDGSMLTGDLNILQARWDVTYRVGDDPASIIKYFKTIGSKDNEEDERRLVRVAIESAVVREISGLGVFDVYPTGTLPTLVRNRASGMLRTLNCGLDIEQVNVKVLRPPLQVKDSFDQVLVAQQTARTRRTNAERQASKLLIDAAGEVGIELGEAIKEWWAARDEARTGDTTLRSGASLRSTSLNDAEERIRELFLQAGGESKSTIAKAVAYKTSVVEAAKADAAQIESLLANSPRDVKTYLDHRHVEALQEVLNNCYEKFLYQPIGSETDATLEIWLNRRPELLLKQREVQDTQ